MAINHTYNALLKLRHVQQTYASGQRRFTAVQDVNLTIYEGEFVALLGPSGCGKSTLLRIITGLQRPSKGTVLYREQPVNGVNPHATIVFQSFALFPWLSVFENVDLALKARGIPSNVRATRTMDLIDRVGLNGFETAYPRELSGGMRQKVGFARAMAVEPELLCLDEPFSALDVLSAESLRSELMELWTGGGIPTKAILMVSHNIEEAVFMADRIVVMDKEPGRIVAEVKVGLQHPRQRKSEAFQKVMDKVYSILAGQTEPETIELGVAPGEQGRTRSLPNVTITDLAGLLEQLSELPENRFDIYRLPHELGVNSDHLLSLTEAAEILGFVYVEKGDITLTSLGETFAEASIQARKEIFAARIRRVPLMRWLMTMLNNSENRALNWDIIYDALESEFPEGDAEKQLDILIDWGRHAELISYNDDKALVYLKTPS
ncbi:Bicarbonate transport ATP-binding protein CmpD [Candidatus Brocadiaceae bacterium B188]|jgi:NitT/TauT family transport system ATP-binding protein|nr:AAA-associated domain-containing protein [Candidatus Brocadia sapporoensis]OQZ02170.1 MAG: nitrate ABC transporter ATP-binding protein [Candidatus Brocadia sp. UTAMX1]QQR65632.1 MAG: AAA-associated domain-containing protein [Candidatus Brocadia sp.]RZV59867.1 MAG: ATP-binding cassette domain-containing protein [Candidatus Brocadia sp. BROELEC01]TWU49938.1 Bicarbonate transport ATP-binding protein CmpD [Candidatus Brocadiaceae bacterium B188]